jgi:uncharacterized C2H2 Zn-finger protein
MERNMTDAYACPGCSKPFSNMDRLVDHVSDEHGWAVAAELAEVEP